MRNSDQKKGTTDRKPESVRAARATRLKDPTSHKLESVRRKMGNSALSEQVQGAGAKRGDLTRFIAERLKVMRGVQKKEVASMGAWRSWFRSVAKGKEGFGLPDATRFHEAARQYKLAGQALARGDLGRGAEVLKRAMDAEQAAMRNVPKYVRDKMNAEERSEQGAPEGLSGVRSSDTCPATTDPAELELADKILAVSDQMDKVPYPGMRRVHWWDEEEEEEEEEGEDT